MITTDSAPAGTGLTLEEAYELATSQHPQQPPSSERSMMPAGLPSLGPAPPTAMLGTLPPAPLAGVLRPGASLPGLPVGGGTVPLIPLLPATLGPASTTTARVLAVPPLQQQQQQEPMPSSVPPPMLPTLLPSNQTPALLAVPPAAPVPTPKLEPAAAGSCDPAAAARAARQRKRAACWENIW